MSRIGIATIVGRLRDTGGNDSATPIGVGQHWLHQKRGTTHLRDHWTTRGDMVDYLTSLFMDGNKNVKTDQLRRSLTDQIPQTTGMVVSQDSSRYWSQPCELFTNLHRRAWSITKAKSVEVWRLRCDDLQAEMSRLRNESSAIHQTKQRRREPLVNHD